MDVYTAQKTEVDEKTLIKMMPSDVNHEVIHIALMALLRE